MTEYFHTWNDIGTHLMLDHCGLLGSRKTAVRKTHITQISEGRYIAWVDMFFSIFLILISTGGNKLLDDNERLVLGALGGLFLGFTCSSSLLRCVRISTANQMYVKHWCCDERDGPLLRTAVFGLASDHLEV